MRINAEEALRHDFVARYAKRTTSSSVVVDDHQVSAPVGRQSSFTSNNRSTRIIPRNPPLMTSKLLTSSGSTSNTSTSNDSQDYDIELPNGSTKISNGVRNVNINISVGSSKKIATTSFGVQSSPT
jgi:hypothetical protein